MKSANKLSLTLVSTVDVVILDRYRAYRLLRFLPFYDSPSDLCTWFRCLRYPMVCNRHFTHGSNIFQDFELLSRSCTKYKASR
jgi:hypothetical protein